MKGTFYLFYLLALLGLWGLPSTATAQPNYLQSSSSGEQLFKSAEGHYLKGNYQQALPLFQKASKTYTNTNAKATALVMETLTLLKLNKNEASYKPLFAAERLDKEKGIQDKDARTILNLGLGSYHWAYRERKEAMPLIKAVEKKVDANQVNLPISLGIEVHELIGNNKMEQGDYEAAIEHFNKAIAKADQLKPEQRNLEQYAEHRILVGELYEKVLEPVEAIGKYEKVLAQKTEVIQDDESKEIELHFRIGAAYFKRKDFESAIASLSKTLGMIEAKGLTLERKGATLQMLASILLSKRQYAEALNYNSKALALFGSTTSKDDLNYLYQALLNEGKLFQEVEIDRSNLNKFKIANKGKNTDWKAQLATFGLTPIKNTNHPPKTTDFNLALVCYLQAESLIPQFPSSQHVIIQIEVEMAKGALFFKTGEYSRAKQHYEKALELMKQIYAEKHPLVAEASRMLSEIYLAEALFAEAMVFVDKALEATLEGDAPFDKNALPDISRTKFPLELLNAIITKGKVLYGQSAPKPSIETAKRVLKMYDLSTELLNTIKQTYRDEGAKYRLADITHSFSYHGMQICHYLHTTTGKRQYLYKAFEYVEQSKSALLLEALRGLQNKPISDVEGNQLLQEKTLKVELAYLKSEIFYEYRQGKNKDLRRIVELEAQVEQKTKDHLALIKQLGKANSKYFNLKYNYDYQTIAALQTQLKPSEVFLQYAATDSFIYVIAVQKDSVVSHFQPLKFKLGNKIQRLYIATLAKKSRRFAKAGYDVYQAALEPVADFIANKKLILALDAELNYIPFGILPTTPYDQSVPEDELFSAMPFLIEQTPITYSYSANFFLYPKQETEQLTGKVAAWAPNFSVMDTILKVRGDDPLMELPGAQKEVTTITQLFNHTPFIGAMASEAHFKATAPNYQVLHVATHGILADKDPLFSKLVFCPADGDDGLLHTYELYNMKLPAEMAVLSACNSGVGKIQRGEGVVSLARGFAYAGVPNIVMTTWSVSDWSTGILMQSFYRNLRAGLPKDEALQQAKLSFLAEYKKDPLLAAPFFWGSLVLVGKPDPIYSLIQASSWWWYLALGMGILIILGTGIWWWKKRQQA